MGKTAGKKNSGNILCIKWYREDEGERIELYSYKCIHIDSLTTFLFFNNSIISLLRFLERRMMTMMMMMMMMWSHFRFRHSYVVVMGRDYIKCIRLQKKKCHLRSENDKLVVIYLVLSFL